MKKHSWEMADLMDLKYSCTDDCVTLKIRDPKDNSVTHLELTDIVLLKLSGDSEGGLSGALIVDVEIVEKVQGVSTLLRALGYNYEGTDLKTGFYLRFDGSAVGHIFAKNLNEVIEKG